MSKRMQIAFLLCACVRAATSSAQAPLGGDFTYQGRLSGVPAIGNADFQFSLFDAVTGGTMVAPMLLKDDVGIIDGLFTVSIDFGTGAFNGDARWIEVAVRSPAGAGGFTTLAQRQPITTAPYATFAKYSQTTRGINVDANNRVGIGTATPGERLTVAGDMELGTAAGDYRHMRIGGGNSSGFLYGSFPELGDGIHMGYNYFADAAGAGHIIDPSNRTSRISMGFGSIALATGGVNQVPVDRVFVRSNGDIGIGTPNPAADLDVRGNIKLGSTGQFFAPAGDESLRIVRGNVDGTGETMAGSGFTCTRTSEGVYEILFEQTFASLPTMEATVYVAFSGGGPDRPVYAHIDNLSQTTATVRILNGRSPFEPYTNSKFSFWAIGPR